MKKDLYLIMTLLSFYIGLSNVYAVELKTNSENIILYNLDEHKILYEKNAEEQISIASMTKIMTAIVALEQIDDLDEKVILTTSDFQGLEEANASVAGFKIGQKVTYRDLLYGLLLPSGADAAQALTRNIAGSQKKFVKLMNEKAEELKLKHTHFMNETGLDEENHYSTVKEVATIFEYALKNKDFKEIITSSSYMMSDQSFSVYSTIFRNQKRYNLGLDYLEGGKTGTTFDAGLCLASIAKKDGISYMLITARAPYDKGPMNFYDATTIYEYFMEHYGNKTIIEKGQPLLELKTKYSKQKQIIWKSDKQIQKYLSNDFSLKDIKKQYSGEEMITPNMKVGTKLGTLTITYRGETIHEQNIILEEKIPFSLFEYLKVHIEIVIISIIMAILFIFTHHKKKRSKKKRK